MKQKTGNLFTNLGTSGRVGLLLGGVVALLIAAVAVLVLNQNKSKYDTELLVNAGELRVLSQEIAKNSSEASAGKEEAFSLLQRARAEFEIRWNYILNGNVTTGMPSVTSHAPDVNVNDLGNVWIRVSDSADLIVESRATLLALHNTAVTLAERIPELQVEYDEVVEIMLSDNSDPTQVALAQRQSWLAERIVRSINKVLVGGEGAVMAADSFERDAVLFQRVLDGMRFGDPAIGVDKITNAEAADALGNIAGIFEYVSGSVTQIMSTSPELFQVREAAGIIFSDSQTLLDLSSKLANDIQSAADSRGFGALWAGMFLGLAIVLIIVMAVLTYRETQRDLQLTSDTNQQNQNAILRLLDELADLADGDLTAQATVTEDFTGAIADSINFAIDQMRTLVSSINTTAVQVSSAAQETQATAMHLAEASEHQAQEIAGASAAVNEMAVSIDQVSANAAESAAVAERSVAIAKKGADVVQATINGMDNIREQIQETSKRIKRLGESSQEIGDIVSLINDIADQTNILALNAAIQASMAGDAGRGFAVVADEVQRLAERSSAATKQIEALVKTIQNDTNEAVISMEQTVAEVVRGARLAQDAGVALEEIESVSKNLADLIQNISNAARQQASSAGHISNTMNVIQEITSQTSAGTTATAKSIGNLAQLANDLQSSVAGFKLPESDDEIETLSIVDIQEDTASIS
ncbi:methyl-accepting chemotaxis protein [Reinekea marinisedimentorum]|uniref:Twitching motility protein PilJ n=1 Tax=Reinekea marinisedimentorum TaxID=230495 RepID=A0A4R3I9X4_9GAMM|nr:methyl-accepting chemotaxis protein [Reinekea marinisedimentorum]TCS43219.1 twitching motility protein PilJ [Reinekea marinisedimentorum]